MHDGASRAGPPSAGGRPFLSTGAAAALAACHQATIRRAVRAGALPAVQLGPHGHLRIPVDALEEWLQPAQPEDTRS